MKKNTGKNVQGIEENAVVRLKAFCHIGRCTKIK